MPRTVVSFVFHSNLSPYSSKSVRLEPSARPCRRVACSFCAILQTASLQRKAVKTCRRHLLLQSTMASAQAMLLLLLGLLLSAGPGTLAKKGKAETIDSKFQPGEGGIAERTGEAGTFDR